MEVGQKGVNLDKKEYEIIYHLIIMPQYHTFLNWLY